MPANDIFDGLRLALHGVAEAAKQATLRIAGAAIGGGGVLFLLLPKHSLSEPAVLLLTVGAMALGAVLGRLGDAYVKYMEGNIGQKRRPPKVSGVIEQ